MRRIAVSVVGLSLAALVGGCTASGSGVREQTGVRLGAGDALGATLFAHEALIVQGDAATAGGYATADGSERPSN